MMPIRGAMAFVLGLASSTPLAATAADSDMRAYQACRSASDLSAPCRWVRATLSANNGSHSTRLGPIGGHIAAIRQPGVTEPTEFLPRAAAALLSRGPNQSVVEGEYLFCPRSAFPDAEGLIDGCIAGARDLRARAR